MGSGWRSPRQRREKSTRGGRITPGEWERRTGLRLRFIYRRRGPSLLVAEGRLNTKGRAVASSRKPARVATVPIFLLVPQVKLRNGWIWRGMQNGRWTVCRG